MKFRDWFNENFQNVIKGQLKVPRKIWTGMPFVASNIKINGKLISQPTSFIVVSSDDKSVTIKKLDYLQSTSPDMDGDIQKQECEEEMTVPIDDFYKMVQPPNIPQASPGGF
jgi:hypothetical protein